MLFHDFWFFNRSGIYQRKNTVFISSFSFRGLDFVKSIPIELSSMLFAGMPIIFRNPIFEIPLTLKRAHSSKKDINFSNGTDPSNLANSTLF